MEVRRNRISANVRELYRFGMPLLDFVRTGPMSASTHTSGHNAVHANNEREFAILDEFGVDAELEELNYSSAFLSNNNVRLRRANFSGESGIQTYVGHLLNDVIALLGNFDSMQLLCECSITNEVRSQSMSNWSDFWVIYKDERPILIVVVKSPAADDDGNILEDLNVLGQVYDYLKNIQEFYGVVDAFAVLTSMKHWKLVWLPPADNLAAAHVVPLLSAPAAPTLTEERIVHSSQTYRQDDEQLIRILMSAIKKAEQTRFRPVPILAHARLYVRVREDSWEWYRPTVSVVQDLSGRLTLSFAAAVPNNAQFMVLKCLLRRAECKVWLSVVADTASRGTVCVVKQCEDQDMADHEASIWRTVNGSPHVTTQLVGGQPSLILPFVVTAVVRADNTVEFDFDPRSWLVQKGAIAGQLPSYFESQGDALRNLASRAGLLNAQTVAQAAITYAAQQGVCHEDLEWRHIALIPSFDDAGNAVNVRPGLIDFGMAQTNASLDFATQTMERKINQISRGKRFE